MRRVRLMAKLSLGTAVMASAVVAFQVPRAKATTVDLGWSISGTITYDPHNLALVGTSFSGNGTLEASSTDGSPYTITSMTGTLGGNSVTGPISGGEFSQDALLYYPASADLLDFGGVSLATGPSTGSFQYNIYSSTLTGSAGSTQYACGSVGYCVISGESGLPLASVSFSVSATPLPAALPLFATGLGGLGLLGSWRKRKDKPKNAPAIAA